MSATERSGTGGLRRVPGGRGWIALAAALIFVLVAACGGSEEAQKATVAASAGCTPGPKGESTCGPLPTPACNYDIKTGWPLPGSDPHCPPVLPCDGCTLGPTAPAPTIDLGPFKPNPAAVLSSPPVHRVGNAKALGRADCPEGWQALVSDTTGMSVCFPPDGTLGTPGLQHGETWDEAASVRLDAPGYVVLVAVHRIGESSLGLPGGSLLKYTPAEFSGSSATRFEMRRPNGEAIDLTVMLQEEFGYLLTRTEGTWEARVTLETRSAGASLDAAEIAAARAGGEAILATVRIP